MTLIVTYRCDTCGKTREFDVREGMALKRLPCSQSLRGEPPGCPGSMKLEEPNR